ncbi:DUF559 domain-containing protein [Catellatospora sp. NPDC049609]|uniref:DUF559 domain-containing protein n=1 Tax=Catellatospora sp. NPDC049609 TaxID=3155505 RepID=UPI00342219AC
MRPALRDVLNAGDGVVTRTAAECHEAVDRNGLAYAVRAGHVLRPLPRTFLLPELLEDPHAVLRAALAYADGPVAASHLSALRVWGLPVPGDVWTHLMTGETRHVRGAPGVLVHRRAGFVAEPPDVLEREGVPVTRLEAAIVDSWPLLDGEAKRAPAIMAVNNRMTTPARLTEELARAPRLAGRRHLVHLVDRLEAGCRSPLELWGYDRVFRGRAFAGLKWQVPVRLDGRTVILDVLDEATGVNVELDGLAHHSSRQDREWDMRRDAALSALGYTVVRYSGARLLREPDAVRAEVLRTLSTHRLRR